MYLAKYTIEDTEIRREKFEKRIEKARADNNIMAEIRAICEWIQMTSDSDRMDYLQTKRMQAKKVERLKELLGELDAVSPLSTHNSVLRLKAWNVPVMGVNAIYFANIKTIGELQKKSLGDIYGIRGVGIGSLIAIQNALIANNLKPLQPSGEYDNRILKRMPANIQKAVAKYVKSRTQEPHWGVDPTLAVAAAVRLQKPPAQAAALTPQDEIAEAIAMAGEAGLQIPTHPNARYTLLITSEFFANGELKEQQQTYGDRFNLDAVSGSTADQFIANVLANPNVVKDRTIVLLPNELPNGKFEDKHFQALKDAGIRFIITNRNELLKARADQDAYRAKFQQDTYAMMLLVRAIDDTVTADSAIYRLLSFYLKTHFSFTDKMVIDDYIMAIAKNEIGKLIQGILAYRPAQAYDKPEYEKVAATLIAA